MSLRTALIAVLSVVASAAAMAADRAADLDGRFTLRFQEIQCVRAPCPPGIVVIEPGKGASVAYGSISIARIVADPRTSPELAERLAKFPVGGPITVDGEMRIETDKSGSTAVIYARSIERPAAR